MGRQASATILMPDCSCNALGQGPVWGNAMASGPLDCYIGRVIGGHHMSIVIARGAEACSVLGDSAFREAWAALYTNCPWRSVFQSPAFVSTWYRVYKPAFEPILLFRKMPSGDLAGFLPLALARDDGALQVAGAPQAEYQAWLARSEDRSFIGDALAALRGSGMTGQLAFTYLPPDTPLDWTEVAPWRQVCEIEPWSRPLRAIGEDAGASLKKKSNKSRLNRLARIGPVRFERVSERVALEEIIEQIELAYDLRQAAVHGGRPFREDLLKREFHLALLEQPDVLHVTVLWAGDRLLAAHIGAADRNFVHNGIIAFDLFDAGLSPGKLHQLLMFQDMAKEGIAFFDLTPGDDPWKERFATEHQTVHRLTLHDSAWHKRAALSKRFAKDLARKLLAAVGLDPRALKARFAAERGEEPIVLLRAAAGTAAKAPGADILAVDCLEDLVAYEPGSGGKSVQRFAREATSRLEQGQRVFTAQRAGCLAFCGWLIERPAKSPITAAEGRLEHPPGRVVLRLDDVTPDATDPEQTKAGLAQMLRAAAAVEGARDVLVVIPARASQARAVAAALGLEAVG